MQAATMIVLAVLLLTVLLRDVDAASWVPQPLPRPVLGVQRVIVVLVDFQDRPHTLTPTQINQTIFTSVAKYWSQVSNGRISVVGNTTRWYHVNESYSYYGENSTKGRWNSTRYAQLVNKVVLLADKDVDFRHYDKIMVVYAGTGEDTSHRSEDLWPAFFYGWDGPTVDGVHIRGAALIPEMETPPFSVIGVYAHEFGHILGSNYSEKPGLADMYDENNSKHYVGNWSLMDSGEWLDSGANPGGLDGWSMLRLGWAKSLEVNNRSAIVEIPPLEKENSFVVKVRLQDGRYYLLEYRTKTGRDQILSTEGLVISIVNESKFSGGGIVQVIDAKPRTASLDDAVFTPSGNFTYTDWDNQIGFVMLSQNTSLFKVHITTPSKVEEAVSAHSNLKLTSSKIQNASQNKFFWVQPNLTSTQLAFKDAINFYEQGKYNEATSKHKDSLIQLSIADDEFKNSKTMALIVIVVGFVIIVLLAVIIIAVLTG